MKVKQFVNRRIGGLGNINYASDRNMLKKYWDTELSAYGYAGMGSNTFSNVTVMVFETARLTVAFVNGRRKKLELAYDMLDNPFNDVKFPDETRNKMKRKIVVEKI